MIRKATIEDINQLSQLFDAYRVFYKKKSDVKAAKEFLTDRISAQESVIFLRLEKEEVTGFVQLYPIFSSTQMKRLWLLNDLYVDVNHRGKGYSKELINACKHHAVETKACGLILETEMSNTIGNQLYPSVGFQKDKEHNFYFWDV